MSARIGQLDEHGLEGATIPARSKIGLDANRPIDPRTGRIEAQVADPKVVASTGTGWIRLNFVLGPWTSPDDPTLHDGRTWAETYQAFVSGFRQEGLSIYGLIGVEAMPSGPGNRFRSPPAHGAEDDEWLSQYAENVARIAEMFHEDIQAIETFNEPDDWHGGTRNWVHPAWFAVMLQRIHAAVRARHQLRELTLVSGPLQGLEINGNAAATYLRSAYRTGKEWFQWGEDAHPVPFDGVGYHLYVKEGYDADAEAHSRAVRATCQRYLDEMHQVILQEEGKPRPLYLSEIGWSSSVDPQVYKRREEFQARSLRAGMETVIADPLVELACWFCTQDFVTEAGEMKFGLFRPDSCFPEARKPAFHAFSAVCAGQIEEETDETPEYTNQQVINAFYRAAGDLGLPSRWSLMAKAGLSLSKLAANRQGPYLGPPVEELPRLSPEEKALVQAHLDAQIPRLEAPMGADAPGAALSAQRLLSETGMDGEIDLDLILACQALVLEAVEHNTQLLETVLARLEAAPSSPSRLRESWRLLWASIARQDRTTS
jgi:hypothetical protein